MTYPISTHAVRDGQRFSQQQRGEWLKKHRTAESTSTSPPGPSPEPLSLEWNIRKHLRDESQPPSTTRIRLPASRSTETYENSPSYGTAPKECSPPLPDERRSGGARQQGHENWSSDENSTVSRVSSLGSKHSQAEDGHHQHRSCVTVNSNDLSVDFGSPLQRQGPSLPLRRVKGHLDDHYNSEAQSRSEYNERGSASDTSSWLRQFAEFPDDFFTLENMDEERQTHFELAWRRLNREIPDEPLYDKGDCTTFAQELPLRVKENLHSSEYKENGVRHGKCGGGSDTRAEREQGDEPVEKSDMKRRTMREDQREGHKSGLQKEEQRRDDAEMEGERSIEEGTRRAMEANRQWDTMRSASQPTPSGPIKKKPIGLFRKLTRREKKVS